MEEPQSEAKQLIDELKSDRSYIRNRVITRIQRLIELTAKGGHFPSFESLVKEIMDEISLVMDENIKLEVLAWSVILQAKEPDRYCDKTMQLIGEPCQENSDVRDAEKSNPPPNSNDPKATSPDT